MTYNVKYQARLVVNQLPHSLSLWQQCGISSSATPEPEKEQGNTEEKYSAEATKGGEGMKAPDQTRISCSNLVCIQTMSENIKWG